MDFRVCRACRVFVYGAMEQLPPDAAGQCHVSSAADVARMWAALLRLPGANKLIEKQRTRYTISTKNLVKLLALLPHDAGKALIAFYKSLKGKASHFGVIYSPQRTCT